MEIPRDTIVFQRIPRSANWRRAYFYVFLSIVFFFVTFIPSVSAQEIKLHCFNAKECNPDTAPYFGRLSEPAPECASEPEGRQFYCFAPPIKVCPPDKPAPDCDVKLQISIGGKDISGLEGYISALYQYLIAISGILAGIMIVWAGVKWLMSAGNAEMISDAKHKIGGAIIGIVLVVISYVLLQTINPALVTLKLPDIKLSRRLDVMTGGNCTLQSGILCGVKLHDCGTNPAACGGAAVGSCIGQVCLNDDKCAEASITTYATLPGVPGAIIKDKPVIAKVWSCNKVAECKKPCPERSSSSCHNGCALTGLGQACNWNITTNKCDQLKSTNKPCTSNTECESGICNQDDHECAPVGGETGGTDCAVNKDCTSGICNTEADPDECTPVGGYKQNNATCEPDSEDIGGANVNAQCGGSGWKCIDQEDGLGQVDGVCSNGEAGSPCVDNNDCKSGTCPKNLLYKFKSCQ